MFHAIRHPLFLFICFLGFALNLQAAIPTWSVDASQYQYSMSFNAQVVLDGASAPQGNHLVGVFVGNQCRGLASPMEANGQRYYFITVYSNQSSGETLTFKFYNAGTDQLYNSPLTQVFQRNANVGGVSNPLALPFATGNDFPIVFSAIPKQTTISGTPFTPLNSKTYLNQVDQDQLSWQALPGPKLNASVDANGVLSVSPIVSYWTGTDTVRVVATENGPNAYKDTAIVCFQILPYTQIALNPLPIQQIGPNDAFKSYDVDQYLTPENNCRTYSVCQIPLKGNVPAPNWTVAGGGAGSMTINAKVRFGGKEQSVPGSQLAVFINNELRGVVSPVQSGGSYWYFLIVNNGAAGPITFKYYDPANQYLYTCASTLNFVSNTTAGTIMAPQVVNLEPLDIQINANGTLTANILNADWLGTQYVEIIAADCTYPNINRDTVIATFVIDPNDTGKPTLFSADSIAFTEASCLPLYDANAFDQLDAEGQGLSYSIIGGADGTLFSLDQTTGKLSWKNAPDFETPLDGNTNNVYEVLIEVRDKDGKTDELLLKIAVLDNPAETFTAAIQSSGFLCLPNNKTVLTASSGQYFLWSTGEKNSEITVSATGDYAVTVTNALGCKDTAYVNIVAVALTLAIDTACLSEKSIALSGGFPLNGTYSGTAVSGTTFEPTIAGVGKFVITYTYTDGVACTNFAKDTFYVLPEPVIANQSIDTICSDVPVGLNFALSSNGTTAHHYNVIDLKLGSLIVAAGNAGLANGLKANALADDVFRNTTNQVQKAVYTVIPFSVDGCPGDTFTVTVPVFPEPVISAGDKTICNETNTALEVVNFNALNGAAFNWTAQYRGATGGSGSGSSVPGNAAIKEVLINPGVTPIVLTYTLAPFSALTQCLGDTIRLDVTLNPRPVMESVADQTACNGGATLPVDFQSPVAGTVFKWSNDNSNFGLAASGQGDIPAFVTQAASTPQRAKIQVRPYFTHAGLTCVDSIRSFSIGVINCEVKIADPCTCTNNAPIIANGTYSNAGTFGETVSVTAPSGQTWSVYRVSGLYTDAAGTIPLAVGTTLQETPANSGNFALHAFHQDSVGYQIVVVNTQLDTLSIGNLCYYPDPVFAGLPAVISPNAAPFEVVGTVLNNPAGTGTFILDGTTQAGSSPIPTKVTLTPGTLPKGTHTLEYRFDAGKPGASLQDPGCIKTVRQQFVVGDCGCQDVVVQLNGNCQLELLASVVSQGNCKDGIVRVVDNNPANGAIIDCPGVWTYGLFDSFNNILCWGKVTAEDKTPPRILCTNWLNTPLICSDVTEVLNNHLSIGNAYGSSSETLLSPTPANSDPSRRTILNAEGVAGVGTQNCALAPPNLLNSSLDKLKNVGYTYFSDNCQTGACACRTTLKWNDRVVYYGCDSIKATGTYARIFREWTGTDCNGYTRDTTQVIRFVRPRAAFGTVATSVQTDGQNTDFQFNGGNTVRITSCQSGTSTTEAVPGYDRVVEYDACSKDYSKIKWQDVTPYVLSPLTGKRKYLAANNDKTTVPADSTLECSYSVNVTDVEFPICNGGVKIDRTIAVMDWCAGQVVKTWKVLIKIGDFKAPVISKIQNPVLSTNAADCSASFNASAAGIKAAFGVTISDNCAASPLVSVKLKSKYHYVKGILTDTTTWREGVYPVVNNRISGLELGPHRLILDVTDNCENCVRDSFEFVVKDQIAPLMKCDAQIRVSLSSNFVYGGDTGPEAIGYAQVSAQDLDEGSTDNCQIRWIQVRRSIGQDCIANFIKKGYDTNGDGKLTPRNKPYVESPGAIVDADKVDGFDRNGDGDIADFGEAFETINGVLFSPLQDQVELFCCDVLQSPTVELWGEDIYGNRNYCWTTLSVEDKIAPTCQAPQDLTLDCDDKCLTWLDAAQHETQADACFGGTANLSNGGECGNVQKAYSVEAVKGKCGIEKYLRKWTFIKKTGKGDLLVTCTQTIYLRNIHKYSIRFPKDASVNCLQTLSPDSVRVAELGCDVLAVNASDKRYAASGDECYKVFRTYTVINWCAYNDQCGDPVQNVHVVPRSIFDNYGKNDLYVLVRDEDRDTEESFWYSRDSIFNQNTDLSFVPTVPGTGSNQCEGEYYHAFQYTQILKVYDNERPVVSGKTQEACIREDANCLAIVDLTVKVEDNCTAGKIELETPQMSVELLQDPNSIMPYQPNRWTITPLTLVSGLKLTEGIAPAEFKIRINGLPQGKHNLVVVARDECGNLSTATRIPFEVKDCKGPAPICINGLSTTLQADGQGGGNATVWATDFVASKVYDCNGQGPESQQGLKLVTHYSINRVGQKALQGQNKLVLNCEDAKLALIPVEIHAWDTQGNHDFCVSFIEVQSNQNACQSIATAGQISGIITTDDAEPFAGVGVELSGGAALKRTTNSAGSYSFLNLTTAKDYTLSVQLDDNPLNGVSTLDLIHMVRHILGVKKLSNPYRLIAADVNNSQSITTLDLVQIRKMILGLETKFSAVPSWRFVDAGYSFPVPSDPWSASFPEVININDLQGKIRADFIAIKMGDVNGTALVNGLGNAEVRTSGQLKLNTQEQSLKMGAEYRVAFTADDLQNIQGYQFALSLDQSKVELLDIEYGVAKAENFGIFKNEGLITTSWNQVGLATAIAKPGALFTLVLRAKAEAKLSSALSLNRRVSPEAYNQHNENLGVALNYQGVSIAEVYQLIQNTPNPFSDETVIGFTLPKETKATLSIRDVKGALIYKVEGNYTKGSNQVTLKKAQLGASGVLYYTLETAEFIATKKMVILE